MGTFTMQTRLLRFYGVRLYDIAHPFVGCSFHDLATKLDVCMCLEVLYLHGKESSKKVCDLDKFVESVIDEARENMSAGFHGTT